MGSHSDYRVGADFTVTSDAPTEIAHISFQFGYPRIDSPGKARRGTLQSEPAGDGGDLAAVHERRRVTDIGDGRDLGFRAATPHGGGRLRL